MKLCNDPIFSEDLVIQTIAEVCRSEDHYDEKKGDFYPWMRGILEHLHAHYKRRLVTRGTTPVDPEILALDENLVTNETDDHILKNSDNDALREAVERLPPIYRQAIVLRYFEEFPAKDIAIITNAPVGTIFRRLNVARKLLAKELAVKFEKKKPIAVLLAVLLGIGTLFGAWQAGLGEWVEELISSPQSEATQPEGTRHSCRVSQDESTASTTTDLTTKEEPPMNTIKGTLLAAATAVSLMSTAQADEPTPVTPDIVESSGAGTVKKVGDDYVLSFTNTTKTYTFTIPDGVESIRYLVVAGGGAGGNGGTAADGGSGGGGGAGGMLTGEGIKVETGNVLTIKVGAGGSGTTDCAGNDGSPSSLSLGSTVIARADGGGGGGAYSWSVVPAHEGGSGGGGNGACFSNRKIGAGANAKLAEGDRKQGNAGGGVATTSKSGICAGGGGGAGEPGGAGNGDAGGAGGAGLACNITGEDLPYAAGGGGANRANKSGGEGGSVVIDGQKSTIGGVGGKNADGARKGTDGTDGTGSGGGGSADHETVVGKGGDGIVIIRYTPPATSKATVYFSHESDTETWIATDIGGEVKEGGEVDNGATVTVVATPKDGYEYASAPEGWTKNEDDTVTAGFVATAPECTIPIPAATAIPFTMNFTPGANASYTATVDGQPVQNGAKIRTGKQIVVVATPNTDCEYTAIPDGWSAGEVEGTFTRTITAGKDTPQLTIPDAAAIDYVQVQFTSNGSAFFEATNAVGEKVEGRVRAGTEVFVKIWAGVGFVYTETPTGWTWEAEGDAYTKAFTAVSGSTLTIQIPNAKEIGGKWTKTIDEHDGYMFETNKDLVVVFTNVTKTHTMILPSGVTSLRYLVVGGGGAGGGQRGGGGGAGGMLTDDDFKVVGRTLKINVGQGGKGVDSGTGTSGGDSKLETGIASIVAYGGGGGAAGKTSPAGEGGSGGGGGGTNGDAKTPLPGASAKDPLQGNAGGTSGNYMSAAGGGGAGDSGKEGSGTAGGAGGAGRTCDITGEDNKYYAAGGGGASRNGSSEGGAGGSGIGGNGGKNADGLKAGLPGVDGTGSGGGGAADDTDDCSGKGGDGVVILRFKKPSNGIVIFIM